MFAVYLCGAITGHEEHAKAWRGQAAKLLFEAGLSGVDPMQHICYPDRSPEVTPADLVRMDKQLIKGSDALLVDVSHPSWGSGMEIFIAKHQSLPDPLPVIGWISSPEHRLSPWIKEHCDRIFNTLEEAIAALVFISEKGLIKE